MSPTIVLDADGDVFMVTGSPGGNSIIGYVAIIQMKLEKQSPLFSYTDEIMKASERATSLTKSLLAFGRKQDISAKAVDANELIRNFEKFIMRIIGEDITLKITCSPEPLTIMADSGQLEQVLMNLATNARDAMPQGGTLSITTSPVELDEDYVSMHLPLKPGRHVQLSISDTGCGMDEATKQKIFEPFFTTKITGVGLGLANVKKIIKDHRGKIWAFNREEGGAEFVIKIPLPAPDQKVVNIEENI
jgi:two-component system NtrC family sensor kinase